MFVHNSVLAIKALDNMPYDNLIIKAKPHSHYQDNTTDT